MKKITLFILFIVIIVSLFFSDLARASNGNSQMNVGSGSWFTRSYAPDLNLQPYFKFTTLAAAPCPAVQALPFWEGFNVDSTTYSCWTIVDNNKDSTSPTGSNIWKPYLSDYFEGDRSMYFSAGSKNDDWLISPAFKLDATKTYKLKYHYKTSSSNNEFEVMASSKGVAVADFTQVIVAKQTYKNTGWLEAVVFITNLGGDINLGWHVVSQVSTSIYIDNVSLQEIACAEPGALGVKDINTTQATLFWNDGINKAWEYYIDEAAGNGPVTAGVSSATSEVIVTKDHNNKNLEAGKGYEYYVRAKCANGSLGDWIGPFSFRTLCNPVTLPYTEGFNTSSASFNCWVVLDNNKDSTSPTGSNIWRQYSSSPHEGDRSMYFSGSGSATIHDDWLISPRVKMNGGIYAITFYYKTSSSNDNDFEVVLSKDGTNPVDFKMVLEAKAKRNATNFVKKTVYAQNVVGDVNIAWHVVAKGSTSVYIDLVSIEEVSCIAPNDDLTVTSLEKDKAVIEWTDPKNSSWEFYTQLMGAGPVPIGSGSLSTKPFTTVTKTSGTGGVNLQPNTWYEFFVRSSCGPGKTSLWIGPIKFKTPCDVATIPFWEGFNKNSKSIDCWAVVDNNKDATSSTSNLWYPYDYERFEGDRSMYFYGTSGTPKHDDWLISPTFKLDPTKYYRLIYHYRSSSYEKVDFEVLLSNKGVALTNFTKVLTAKKAYAIGAWMEERIIIGATAGNINLAWRVTTDKGYTSLYIDNVFLEEVVGCPEPMTLGTKDEKETSATILWGDEYGKNWEYAVQKAGGKAPVGNGTATAKKENVVTKELSGANLQANTAYEFYVRTVCGNGEYSIWMGPFKFRTACGVSTVPFWEGFNADSNGIYCWTIVDGNKDATSATGSNIWSALSYSQFEGTHTMNYYTYNYEDEESDDWLISPILKFDKNKIYRLKYHFKTDTYSDDNEFEVLASNSGIKPADFKVEVVKNAKYKTDVYQQKTTFITGLDGNVNLAWHVKGTGSKEVYIDNVFVEEVVGCPEPLELDVKNIEKNKATITWTDGFKAGNWEYVVQLDGMGLPTGNGTATSKKDNIITQDQSGKTLVANTGYEFYVRTVCGNGVYSIWSGPFKFITLCDVYDTPFWEGFNTDSKTNRCWTIIDGNQDGDPMWGGNMWAPDSYTVYEGNQSMSISVWDWMGEIVSDDWLISPDIKMDNSMYVLKYRYQVSSWDGGSFEVLLSTGGIGTDKFTTTIIPEKNYTNGNWVEEVKFFTAKAGIANIGWHVKTVGSTEVYIDNVSLKKVENCPEPYHVKTTNQTANGMDVEWKQDGGVTSWEVIVVNYGDDETGTPVKTVVVTANPKTTISGLDPGKGYSIFVRAKCSDGKSYSDWSTAANAGTKVGTNDDCGGAINVPVNNTLECNKSVPGSLIGSTKSTTAIPTCSAASGIDKDVWFEFTAITNTHLLTVKDLISISGATTSPYVYLAIYDQPCTSVTNASLMCFDLDRTDNEAIMKNLIPGKKYYIRIGVSSYGESDLIFALCITTSQYTPIEVSPSGDKYTVEELVKDVLVQSNCDLVSNVKYQNGDGGTKAMSYNTLGYFNKAGSDFPFKEGIVLATNEAQYVPGPYMGYSNFRGNNAERWVGDKDVNDAINDAGGGPYPQKRVTQIEFDFIPIKEEIKFDYLFASNSYHQSCGEVCNVGAMFAAWLVDSTTGEGQNLAKVSGTNTPIAINTIRDVSKSGASCGSVNPEWFWKYYDKVDSALEASVDFVGLTKAMSSEAVKVVPGRKYHIKLAVIDFCPTTSHTSAVFFGAGSFDLGNLDLGADMLVENGNALCGGESRVINSGLGTDDVTIKWYKDAVLIPGADQPDLEVTETGEYKVVGKYGAINCEVTGSVKVEIYPAISVVVNKPVTLPICRTSLMPLVLDLTEVEIPMLSKVDPLNYKFTYYQAKTDAEAETDSVPNPKNYNVDAMGVDVIVYIRVEDLRTGCKEIFEWTLKTTAGIIPALREDLAVCASYEFPALEADQHYYTGSKASGVEYKAGDVLSTPGNYRIYVLQDNGGGCYEEISFKLEISARVKADVFEDKTLECELYQLAPLTAHNKYYTLPGGQGVELVVGSFVPHAQTIYVHASSDDGLCIDESSFKITYSDCPIQKGISPNGDGLNDSFDLSQHGVTSLVIYNRYGVEVFAFAGEYTDQWKGQDKNKNLLPDGTYFYVAIAHGKTKSGWVQINK